MSTLLRCRTADASDALVYILVMDVRHYRVKDLTDPITEVRFGDRPGYRGSSSDPRYAIEALTSDGRTYRLVDWLPSTTAAEMLLDRTMEYLLNPEIEGESLIVVVHPSGPDVFTEAEPGSSVHVPLDD